MRLGMGVSAWARGLLAGHIDGIGVYTENLWLEHCRNNVSPHAVAFGVLDEVKVRQEAPRPLECLPGKFSANSAFSIITGLPYLGSGGLRSKIDVFHAPDHHIPKLRSVPVVATIMDAIPIVHPEWVSANLRRTKNAVFRQTVKWAEHVITISEYSKADIVEFYGVCEQDITVIPLGYDESLCPRLGQNENTAVLQKYLLNEGYFLFVGTLQPRKNVRRIIQAHRALSPAIRAAHPLIIVGAYGWGSDDLLRDIEEMEREGFGRWLKWVSKSDLKALMQSATALVYPSLYEGFGLPILEGFAAQIPVISSSTTSIPEVAGEAALLVDPVRVDEISDAMAKVAENTGLAADLVSRGKEQLERYSWASCAQQTREVCQRYSA
ncbi:MAG: glycosyltransferase family 1 protein [Pseudomonadota bacterium]